MVLLEILSNTCYLKRRKCWKWKFDKYYLFSKLSKNTLAFVAPWQKHCVSNEINFVSWIMILGLIYFSFSKTKLMPFVQSSKKEFYLQAYDLVLDWAKANCDNWHYFGCGFT